MNATSDLRFNPCWLNTGVEQLDLDVQVGIASLVMEVHELSDYIENVNNKSPRLPIPNRFPFARRQSTPTCEMNITRPVGEDQQRHADSQGEGPREEESRLEDADSVAKSG